MNFTQTLWTWCSSSPNTSLRKRRRHCPPSPCPPRPWPWPCPTLWPPQMKTSHWDKYQISRKDCKIYADSAIPQRIKLLKKRVHRSEEVKEIQKRFCHQQNSWRVLHHLSRSKNPLSQLLDIKEFTIVIYFVFLKLRHPQTVGDQSKWVTEI